MMFTVSQAKAKLSKLIDATFGGEEVIIAHGAKPLVRLTPVEPAKTKPVFGAAKGQFNLTDAFFEPLPDDLLARWNCESD